MISYVDLGISVDSYKLKKIINEWQSGNLYRKYYEHGYRGVELYENILHELMCYAEDLEDEIRENVLKQLKLTKAQVWYDQYPKSDMRSLGWEVLKLLGWVFDKAIEELTTDDIPMILEFLDTPPGKPLEAWEKWEKYWNNLDYPARRKKLLDNSEK